MLCPCFTALKSTIPMRQTTLLRRSSTGLHRTDAGLCVTLPQLCTATRNFALASFYPTSICRRVALPNVALPQRHFTRLRFALAPLRYKSHCLRTTTLRYAFALLYVAAAKRNLTALNFANAKRESTLPALYFWPLCQSLAKSCLTVPVQNRVGPNHAFTEHLTGLLYLCLTQPFATSPSQNSTRLCLCWTLHNAALLLLRSTQLHQCIAAHNSSVAVRYCALPSLDTTEHELSSAS